MIKWPPSLVREIATRRCIFFLGAGISASSVDAAGNRPKTWGEFLTDAAALTIDPAKAMIEQLISERNYLLALQGIRDNTNPAEYRDLLDKNFNNPKYQPSALHRLINDLDPRVVITTNFDKVYETYCTRTSTEAFKVVNFYSGDLCDELRSDTRVILKAHGTIDEITRMVFTRSEYHQARRDYPRFYEVLKALFLTNTVVFLGCGMQDPDVLLLLEDVKIASSAQRPHYVVTLENSQPQAVVSDWQKTYNVKALFYGPSHADLTTDLEELVTAVDSERAATGIS